MSIQSSMKSIDAQLDRVERQIENAQKSLNELEFMLIEAKLGQIKR